MSWQGKIFLIFTIITLFLSNNFVLAQEKVGERGFRETFLTKVNKGLSLVKDSSLDIWEKLSGLASHFFATAGTIIEQKKPFLKQEWQKEKQEMVEDLIKIKNFLGQKIWQKIK